MAGRPKFKTDRETPQETVERVAQVTDVLFQAPHAFYSYSAILLMPILIVPLFWWRLGETFPLALRNALVLFAVPGILSAAGVWRLAALYGGSYNRRRSAFTAASAEAIVLIVVAVGGLLYKRAGYSFYDPIVAGYAYAVAIHHVALFTTSDHRQIRSSQLALVHPVLGLLMLHLLYETTPREILLSLLLPVLFLATTMYFLDLVDAPIRRNTGLSLSEMFHHYLDHVSKGTMKAEELLLRISSEIDALVGAVAFRRLDGSLKCGIVVPAVHPGPIGHLGGSNLPAKVIKACGLTENLLVPHGPATHDFNPASGPEVDRIGEEARRLISTVTYTNLASPLARYGEDAQVCAQFFGDDALLTYTSWPKPIDDVDYGVGDSAMWSAKQAGARDALFIDAHNSLLLGSGAVWPSDRRALNIIHTAGEAVRGSLPLRSQGIKAGYATTRDAFTRSEGIGEQGCQVVVTEVAGKRSAYILWDGNNMLPEVRGRIRDQVEDLVDEFEVMTTDNHSVNVIAGGYNPVGFRADAEKLGLVSRTTLEAALRDLEPVEAGMKTGRIPGLKVLGHWNTIRLVSAVNTMVSIIPRGAVMVLALQVVMAILTFTLVNHYF